MGSGAGIPPTSSNAESSAATEGTGRGFCADAHSGEWGIRDGGKRTSVSSLFAQDPPSRPRMAHSCAAAICAGVLADRRSGDRGRSEGDAERLTDGDATLSRGGAVVSAMSAGGGAVLSELSSESVLSVASRTGTTLGSVFSVSEASAEAVSMSHRQDSARWSNSGTANASSSGWGPLLFTHASSHSAADGVASTPAAESASVCAPAAANPGRGVRATRHGVHMAHFSPEGFGIRLVGRSEGLGMVLTFACLPRPIPPARGDGVPRCATRAAFWRAGDAVPELGGRGLSDPRRDEGEAIWEVCSAFKLPGIASFPRLTGCWGTVGVSRTWCERVGPAAGADEPGRPAGFLRADAFAVEGTGADASTGQTPG